MINWSFLVVFIFVLGCGRLPIKNPRNYKPSDKGGELFLAKPNYSPKRFGFNLVSWEIEDAHEITSWINSIDALQRIGIGSITFVTYRFVDQDTGEVYKKSKYGLNEGVSNQVLVEAIQYAKSLNFDVSINPFVEIDNPNGVGNLWRGTLDFEGDSKLTQLNNFYRTYSEYLFEMASISNRYQVDRLYLGSELTALTRNKDLYDFWGVLLQSTRQKIGRLTRLTYAAHHSNIESFPFWSSLDEIAVDHYLPLMQASEAEGVGIPSYQNALDGFRNSLKRYRRVANEYRKELIISEWGTVPFDLTTAEPWNATPSEIRDELEQEHSYKAALEGVALESNWLKGIQFWHWNVGGKSKSYFAINEEDKIAEMIKERLVLSD